MLKIFTMIWSNWDKVILCTFCNKLYNWQTVPKLSQTIKMATSSEDSDSGKILHVVGEDDELVR